MEKPAAGRTKRVNNQGGRNRHTMRPPCPAYFFFLGPLGLEVAFRSNPFRKWVVSNFSKKTNNPNPSPIGKRFGLYGRGGTLIIILFYQLLTGIFKSPYLQWFQPSVSLSVNIWYYPKRSP